jgi:L-histidine N-alpha-methyltransferase
MMHAKSTAIETLKTQPLHPIVRLWRPGQERERFMHAVHEGLSKSPKQLPSMYFYDDRGSELFARITRLPEYYPTRIERAILMKHGPQLSAALPRGLWDVVDLGAGDSDKARLLLAGLHGHGKRVRYLPVDVSERALVSALSSCRQQLPWLSAEGIVAEYRHALRWVAELHPARKRLVLFLGSNIGNMSRVEAATFLRDLRAALRPGDHVLVGFDLVKDPALLRAAYDDSAGVTAEFNLNLLARMNRELGADFVISAFEHVATYCPSERTMKSYLVTRTEQVVNVDGARYVIEPWEAIETERSHKYREHDVSMLARDAGFATAGMFGDERRFFVDALLRVEPYA